MKKKKLTIEMIVTVLIKLRYDLQEREQEHGKKDGCSKGEL